VSENFDDIHVVYTIQSIKCWLYCLVRYLQVY